MTRSMKLLAKAVLGVVVAVLSILALYYLPVLIAVPIILVALLILLSMAGGRIGRRRDQRDKLLADAAQRGDSSFFVDPRDHRF